MQVEISSARGKAEEVITKCKDLFDEKKYYEFGQKVKLFSHRKLQGNKPLQGLYILQIASIKLLTIGEDKQAQQLINQWLKQIESRKQLFQQNIFDSFIEMYNVKPTQQRAKQLQGFVRLFKDKLLEQNRSLVNSLLVQQYSRLNQYSAAQKYALYENINESQAFLKRWEAKLPKDEGDFVRMRFALLKILYGREDESQFIIESIQKQSPFRRFAYLLIESFNTQSKEAFEKIGNEYAEFLTEPSIQKLYWALGFAIFGIRNPNSNSNLLAFLQ